MMEKKTIKANEDNYEKYLSGIDSKKKKNDSEELMKENTGKEERLEYFTE